MNYSQHNQQLLDTATQVQEVLSRHGLSSGIAGGFARDAFYGLDAKDIDVWVYGLDMEMGAAEDLPSVVADLTQQFPHDAFICNDESYEGHSDNRQIYAVLKLRGGGDVIFIADSKDPDGFRQDTLKSVVDRFDYNINQFIISDGVPLFLGDKHHPVCCGLVNLRDDTPPERIEKMEQRWARILEAGA